MAAAGLRASRIELSGPAEQERIEPILRNYEVELVPALRAARGAERRSAHAGYAWSDIGSIIARDLIPPTERPDLYEEQDRLLKQVGEERRRPALRLVAINRNYLTQLKAALSPENAERLDRLYKQNAWPDVYPDLASAMHLFDEVLAWDDLDDDQRGAIELRQSEFRRRHDQLSAGMAEGVSRRRSLWLRAEDPDKNARDGRAVARLSAERFALDAAQRARIAEFLTPVQLERLPQWIYANRPEPKPWNPGQWDDEDRRRHGR